MGIFEGVIRFVWWAHLTGTSKKALTAWCRIKQTDALEQVWVAYNDQDELALRELVAQMASAPCSDKSRCILEFTDSVIELIPPFEENDTMSSIHDPLAEACKLPMTQSHGPISRTSCSIPSMGWWP